MIGMYIEHYCQINWPCIYNIDNDWQLSTVLKIHSDAVEYGLSAARIVSFRRNPIEMDFM